MAGMGAVAFVLAVAFALSLFEIVNYDFWWILSDGKYVVENMAIPKIDVFRFVSIKEEYKWVDHIYLTGLIFYLIYIAGGFGALSFFKSTVVALTFGLLYLALKQTGKDRLVALALVLLAIFAVRFRLLMRPDVLTFLLFVSTYYIVDRYRKGINAPLYLVPVIMLLWANLHGGYIAGIVLLGTVMAAECCKSMVAGKFGLKPAGIMKLDRLKSLSICGLISALLVVLNPAGLEVYKPLKRFLLSHTDLATSVATARLGEWQPLSLYHFKGLGICFTSEYGVVLLLVLISSLFVLKRLDFTDLLLSGGFFYASIVSIRFIPVAVFVMVPFIYRNYCTALDSGLTTSYKRAITVIIAVTAITGLGLGIAGLSTPPALSAGLGVKAGKFPEGAVKFIKDNGIDGNIFNTYGIGGYLIWAFYPERRVFMDGRGLENNNLADYYEMIDSAEHWKRLEGKYGFDVVLLANEKKDFAAHIFSNPEWKLVYWDDRGIVLLKDIPKYRHIIEKKVYLYTMPTFYDFAYLDHFLESNEKVARVGAEFLRNIKSTERNSEARLALAFLYFNSGKRYYDFAFKQIKKAVQLSPDLAMAHSALGGMYLQRGMKDEGVKELKKALRLDPYDVFAMEALSQLSGKEQ